MLLDDSLGISDGCKFPRVGPTLVVGLSDLLVVGSLDKEGI